MHKYISFRWRHTEHDGVSNNQPYDCLYDTFLYINGLFRYTVSHHKYEMAVGLSYVYDDILVGQHLYTETAHWSRLTLARWQYDERGQYRPRADTVMHDIQQLHNVNSIEKHNLTFAIKRTQFISTNLWVQKYALQRTIIKCILTYNFIISVTHKVLGF